jgi:hypothetical protein
LTPTPVRVLVAVGTLASVGAGRWVLRVLVAASLPVPTSSRRRPGAGSRAQRMAACAWPGRCLAYAAAALPNYVACASRSTR